MRGRGRYGLTGVLLLFLGGARTDAGAYHQTPLTAPATTNLPQVLLTNSLLRPLPDGGFALGLVQLDKTKGTVKFPCEVNMPEGVVEYAVVHSTGKVHESVFKTEADPFHIHLATLLITPTNQSRIKTDPGTARELMGPRVRIWASWSAAGQRQRVPLETMVSNTMTRAAMTLGPWVYNGSRVVAGTFITHRDGSIVSVISDPDALVNNPRPGRDDDEIWRANQGVVPSAGTLVDITLELQKD